MWRFKHGGHAAGRVRVPRLCPPYEFATNWRACMKIFQSETAPVKGPLGLIPIAVTALDDHRAFAAVPVPAAMQAAVVLTELGACAAEVIAVTEPDPIAVAADADANAEIFRAGDGRCCNGNRRHGCKRKTKFSHVPSS